MASSQRGRPRDPGLQDRFYGAALHLLATQGYAGLKLGPLVRRLDLTTGAFYHSFDSWKQFTDALVEHWHDEGNAKMAIEMTRIDGPQDQMLFLRRTALGLHHESESAIRAWASVDPVVRDAVARVERLRIEVSTVALTAFTGDPVASRQLARVAVYLVSGYGQAQFERRPEDLEAGLTLVQLGAERARDRAGVLNVG